MNNGTSENREMILLDPSSEYKQQQIEALEGKAQTELKINFDPELAESLKAIDFNRLQTIFINLAQKSGIDAESLNFFGSERFTGQQDIRSRLLGAGAGYKSSLNIIKIDQKNLKGLAQELRLNEELTLLFTVIHELTHATGKLKLYEYAKASDSFDVEAGYEKFEWQNPADNRRHFRVYEGFNEGIVQGVIAADVFKRYLAGGKFSKQDAENFLRQFINNTDYQKNVLTANYVIEVISKETGLPEQVVRQAFIAGHFNGDNLYQGQLKDFLGEFFSEDQLEQIQRGRLKYKSLTVKSKRAIDRFRRHINLQ